MREREAFKYFITDVSSANPDVLMEQFERYLDALLAANSVVNLVSRKTLPEEYWTRHFLDSLVPLLWYDFTGATILDFGTGGGLPGIPLKIMHPDAVVYLLDSRQKKIDAIKKIMKSLDGDECFTIVSRLEELGKRWYARFDYIVCRSVKIEPRYVAPLLNMVKPGGKILLYKSRKLKDCELFASYKVNHWKHELVGERRIVEIAK
ncbi:MAG: 16S rRNA (guanine(527)-N(7))-methyltransferase RsmG [Candidatus Cloacimonetes bacterium]|nr:16S rRNA (guanine(527)-N(7))-methyltransferase RsmG [Candidatus Cloacimonadota bacterium]